MQQPSPNAPCPCGGPGPAEADYGSCCGMVHANGAGLGSTAQQLMRARYSAYVLHDDGFLLRSWHPDTRPHQLSFDPTTTWLGLTIEKTVGGGGLETTGTVTFTARFRRGTGRHRLHECSSFHRVDGSWLYVDGFDPGSG